MAMFNLNKIEKCLLFLIKIFFRMVLLLMSRTQHQIANLQMKNALLGARKKIGITIVQPQNLSYALTPNRKHFVPASSVTVQANLTLGTITTWTNHLRSTII